jgi:DNA (cytosine-5)-methyltransferase 1
MPDSVVVSLFSGAGGLSRGFTDAGLCPTLAAEIDADAVSTYRANVSDAVIQSDIGLEADRIVREVDARRGKRSVFAVVGGPPCQGFSTAGARNHSDVRNQLVFSYLEIVSRLRPSWFLFENVEGILTSGMGDAVVGLAEQFAMLGYSFRVDKVNFAQWGLPQARKRVLIIGNRHGINFSLPDATHAFDGKKHRGSRGISSSTLGDAIAGLPSSTVASHLDEVSYTTPSPITDYDGRMRTRPPGPRAHTVANFDRDVERIYLLKPGQSLRDLPQELWPESFRSRAFRRVADGMPTDSGGPSSSRRGSCLSNDHISCLTGIHPPRIQPAIVFERMRKVAELSRCS